MRKRTYGTGSVEQLPSGLWRWRLRLPDGRRLSSSPLYPTREDAERILAAARYEILKAPEIPRELTLEIWGERWLARRTVRNQQSELGQWRRHVAGTELAATPLRQIERRHVRAWLDALQTKRALRAAIGGGFKPAGLLSPQTVMLCHGLLRRCLSEAVEAGLLVTNPAAGMRLPRAARTEDTWTYLTTAEIQGLLSCATIPEEARIVYAVAIFTGMRQGELWGLRWPDVILDPQRPILRVRYSYRGPTKGNRVREVPLLPPARQALLWWQTRCRSSALSLVFPSVTGQMRCKGDDAGWTDRRHRSTGEHQIHTGHRRVAGIDRRVRFHDLRHTCASHLAMGSWGRAWRLEEIRDFLGHSEVGVTQRYAHLSPDHLHEAARMTAGWAGLGSGLTLKSHDADA